MTELRTMTAPDLPCVLTLWRNVPEVELNESDTPDQLTKYLARNPELSPVAVLEGEVVGAALCGHDGRRGYLHHLAVATSHRKRGLGEALVEYCLTRLADSGITKCNAFVSPDNGSGRAFWRQMQFQEKPWTFWQRSDDGTC